jgi:hypothetical protein
VADTSTDRLSLQSTAVNIMKPAPIAWSLVAVVLLGGTFARAQSLADLAKKEEERRKATAGPSKVYTNEDLKKYPTPPPTPAPTEGQPAANAGAAPAVPPPGDPNAPDASKPADPSKPAAQEDKKDEAYWKGLITSARTKLERDESYLEALQSRINALTNDFYSRDDPAQRAVIETQRNKALNELERLKKDVSDGKANIVKIQEDARKEGVPPGWLR